MHKYIYPKCHFFLIVRGSAKAPMKVQGLGTLKKVKNHCVKTIKIHENIANIHLSCRLIFYEKKSVIADEKYCSPH